MNTIINFNQRKNEKLANEFAAASIKLVEEPKYKTDGLEAVLKSSFRILYYSGDVKKGEARNAYICGAAQLLDVSGKLISTHKMLGDILRLTFDGCYFYDVYFNENVTPDILKKCLSVLKSEEKTNRIIEEINQTQFNYSTDKLLNR